jgi:hypothetical protein
MVINVVFGLLLGNVWIMFWVGVQSIIMDGFIAINIVPIIACEILL